MKKVIILQVLAGSVTMPALANLNSMLSLTNYDNAKFVMYFDNAFFSTPSNTYNVTDIAPGRHHIRMLRNVTSSYGNCGMPQLLYDGFVNFPGNYSITAYASGIDQFNIVSSVPLVQLYDSDPGYTYGYGNAGGNGYDPYGNNSGYGYGNNNGNSSGYNGWNNYPGNYGMNQQQFDALKATVSAQSFDETKLTIAEQVVASNNISSAQAEELAKLFSFESTKLAFAEYAYGRTADRGNYYLVNNAFTFSSSIDELAAYINSYHG
ncbi:MAG: DUF4476 domain-containing protein [Bacteroidetes bacterium]|nr:DUF4476 domain-containing protein [Bacteroidota bacterium]